MKLFGLRCAIYARRSKEEHQAASIEVQTGEGSRYLTNHGGTLAPEHVFVDADHGRAEFKKRPGLIAMLNAAERGEFDVVVVRDESRLGGDTNRTSLFIQDLLDAGVRLFYYFTDEEVTIDGAVDKFMINVRNFASELEREKISQRTHEHLMTKARRGLVVGGRVYGYDNAEVRGGEQRIRVEYKINEEQAAIIRELFKRYADGEGLRSIVKDLNARRVPPPRAGKRGTGSWATSAVWSMLRRERYRGILVWNTREKTYKGGTKVRIARDPSEWIRTEVPHLRIVDDELWFAVQARAQAQEHRETRRGAGRPARHLLSGLARCGQCGGPMTVTNGKRSYETVKVYGCAYSRDRGKTVCANTLRRPVDGINDAVARWISQTVLSEALLLDVIQHVRTLLAERTTKTTTDLPRMEKEAARLRTEIDRLVTALATIDQKPEAVIRAIADRQEELSALEARLRGAKAAPEAIQLELRRMEAEARRRLDELKGTLTRKPEQAREVISMLFEGPIKLTPIETPEGKRFWVEGSANLWALFAAGCLKSASPAGYARSCTRQNGVRQPLCRGSSCRERCERSREVRLSSRRRPVRLGRYCRIQSSSRLLPMWDASAHRCSHPDQGADRTDL
ncbi:recombinase family protein [Polyangium fumosum]|uniref:Recombinase family protein n=1 Tax=Polyangium fumosum TaxID=889272 RepID=A0A4U1J872_9BACT|nr:recombinase family protein [Polyangium fumosum]TKD03424.1 recombinase family protein [Polyangium fumosum]